MMPRDNLTTEITPPGGGVHRPDGQLAAYFAPSAYTVTVSLGGMAPDLLRPVVLSGRQRQVAVLAARGATNAEIAQALGISFGTARSHLQGAYNKVGARKRSALARALGIGEEVTEDDLAGMGLSPAQVGVAALAIRGMTNKEIAAKRGIAEGTVKVHLLAVYRRTGAANRVDLAALARKCGASVCMGHAHDVRAEVA